MKEGDVVIPQINRFPLVDKYGKPVTIHDDFLGQPAVIIRVERCAIEVMCSATGTSWIYRPGEVAFYCTKAEWRERLAEAVG